MVNKVQNLFLKLILAYAIFFSYTFTAFAHLSDRNFLFTLENEDAEIIHEVDENYNLFRKLLLVAFVFDKHKNKELDFSELLHSATHEESKNSNKVVSQSLYNTIYRIIYYSSDASVKELQEFLAAKYPKLEEELKQFISNILVYRKNNLGAYPLSQTNNDIVKLQEAMILNYPEYKHLINVTHLSVDGIEEENPNSFVMNDGQKIIITSKTKMGDHWFYSFHNTSSSNGISGLVQAKGEFIDADELFGAIYDKIQEIKSDYKMHQLFSKDQLLATHMIPGQLEVDILSPKNIKIMLKNSIDIKSLTAKISLQAENEKSITTKLTVSIPELNDQYFDLENRPHLKDNAHS